MIDDSKEIMRTTTKEDKEKIKEVLENARLKKKLEKHKWGNQQL